MDNAAKTVLLGVGGLLAIRAYQLYELGQKFDWTVKGGGLIRNSINVNTFSVYLDLNITNPTGTSVNISNVYGSLYIGQQYLGKFNSGKFKIAPGNNALRMKFTFDNLALVSQIVTAVAAKKLPLLDLNIITRVSLFTYTQAMKVNLMDYMKL